MTPDARIPIQDASVRQVGPDTFEGCVSKQQYDSLKLMMRTPSVVLQCQICHPTAGAITVRLKAFLERPKVLWEAVKADPLTPKIVIPDWMKAEAKVRREMAERKMKKAMKHGR
jgi:hypothetical protein